MNERTGWNRRWLQSRNPTLEALEARLVLSEAARLGLQPLLAHAGQLGKTANVKVTIDSVVGTVNPKGDSPPSGRALQAMPQSADHVVDAGPLPESPQFLSQDSLTEGRAAVVQQPISQSIEASIVGLAPSPAADAASAIATFAKLAAEVAGEAFPNAAHAPPPSSLKHDSAVPSETLPTPRGSDANAASQNVAASETPPPPRGSEANTARQTADTANSDAGQPAGPTPPPDHAAPEPPNANAGLAQAVASTEPAPGAPPTAPPQFVEALSRQGTLPLIGQAASYLVNPSRFVDGYALQQHVHDPQDLLAADFTALPVDETTQASTPSLIDRLALRLDEDAEAPVAPLTGDLILNFLPCNVSALRTAIENLLTESEQVLMSDAPREGLALGMLIAALATSGIAGHAAWEHLRGPRERAASLAWPEGGALNRRDLAAGLQLSEMP
jgi:hypothetical protein